MRTIRRAVDLGAGGLAFTPDGSTLVTLGLFGGVQLRDASTLAVGGYGRFVRLWDVGTQTLLHELDAGVDAPRVFEFSPDGHTIAVAGALWDVVSGARIGPVLAAGPRTSMMDLSTDGRMMVVTSTDGHAAIWDVDPESWAQRACALVNRTLTPEEWTTFLPGRPYEPACRR
jgi:WD40 repeat protein